MRQDEILEVERVVSLLDEGQFFAAFTFALPVSIFTQFVFCQLTKRNFKLNISHIVDIATFITVAIWYVKSDEYMKVSNEGFNLQENPTRAQMFLQCIMDHIRDESFNFDFLLAGIALFLWMRLLIMLQLTETFGPLIQIIVQMMKDLIIFFGLFVIQIVTFAAVGILLFGDIKEFDDIQNTSLMFFQYALGLFDMTIYDGSTSSRKLIGIIYSCIVLVVNMLVLMNLLIAIMQDTYKKYSQMKRGLLFK